MSDSRCECGCCHVPDHGACPTPEIPMPWSGNGRCVYCDHALPCHKRDKNTPTFNTPLGVGFRDKRLQRLHGGIDVG